MEDLNYSFLVSSLKSDIRVAKSLIETFTKSEKESKEKGFDYGEGLNRGWVDALKEKVNELERRLIYIGEELEDDSQRTSAESLIG